MDDFESTPSILAVGAKLANLQRAKLTHDVDLQTQVVEVDSGRQAFDLLRVLKFDLVAVGPGVNDMTPGQFAQRLHAARPWQKWAMVADEFLPAEDEVMARSFGALAVLDGPDAWRQLTEMARTVRRRHPATRVPGLAMRSAAM